MLPGLRCAAECRHDVRVDGNESPAAWPAALPGWSASARYLALTTFRRSGAAVTTPVWFARDGGRLLVWTGAATGKVQRLRANPAVTIASCSVRGKPAGPASPGTARLLPGTDAQLVQHALRAKYGMAKRSLDLYNALIRRIRRRPAGQGAYIEIRPAAALAAAGSARATRLTAASPCAAGSH